MKKLIKKAIAIVGLISISSLTNVAFADSIVNTLNINTTIAAVCLFDVAPLAFGNFVPTSGMGLATSTTINIICTKGTAYSISLSTGSSGTYSGRTMNGSKAGNTDVLNYQLYIAPNGTFIYGDGTNGTTKVGGTSAGLLQSLHIYGRLFANQVITPDNYSDTITMTVAY